MRPVNVHKLSIPEKKRLTLLSKGQTFFVERQNIVFQTYNFSHVAPTSCVVQIAITRFSSPNITT